LERYNKYLFSLPQYEGFESRRKPILVATSSFRCGIDIEGVKIVLNYDISEDTNTYLQQVCSKTKDFSSLICLILGCLCWWI